VADGVLQIRIFTKEGAWPACPVCHRYHLWTVGEGSVDDSPSVGISNAMDCFHSDSAKT
jgi:hypothetical protein